MPLRTSRCQQGRAGGVPPSSGRRAGRVRDPRHLRACVGKYTTPENTLARELIERLEAGMLVLADRGFCGFPLWSRAVASGADLLWRANSTMKPRFVEALDDGSWLAELRPRATPADGPSRCTFGSSTTGSTTGGPTTSTTGSSRPSSTPVTSRLDLAAAYTQRWEIESALTSQDPPTWSADRVAIQVARSRAPRNLGTPLLPLRHPHADVGSGGRRRRRSRPGQLRHSSSYRSPLDCTGAGFFPLGALSEAGDTPSPSWCDGSIRPGACARTRGSSNASTSSGM